MQKIGFTNVFYIKIIEYVIFNFQLLTFHICKISLITCRLQVLSILT